MSDNFMTRFLGGSPLTVLLRLAVVSVLVGALMSWLGIDAADLLYDLQRGFERLYGSGFAALRDIGRTLAAGAAVVLPIWLVLRLLSYRGPRNRPAQDAPRVDMPRDAAFMPDAPYPGASRWSNRGTGPESGLKS